MSVIENFKDKSSVLQERLNVLNDLLYDMKQEFIKHDVSIELAKGGVIHTGSNKLTSYEWIDEAIINGEVLRLINKTNESYKSYVVYTEKEYSTIGLGFKYKNDIVSPHMNFVVEGILEKYNEGELLEIIQLIENELVKIEADIKYLNQNKDISLHKYYYKNYDGLFEGSHKFETISDVIANFKF